jgi:chromosome segregation ATPase
MTCLLVSVVYLLIFRVYSTSRTRRRTRERLFFYAKLNRLGEQLAAARAEVSRLSNCLASARSDSLKLESARHFIADLREKLSSAEARIESDREYYSSRLEYFELSVKKLQEMAEEIFAELRSQAASAIASANAAEESEAELRKLMGPLLDQIVRSSGILRKTDATRH